ncbi:response regulator transcription factor [Paenibacillus sp.]|uniref:response regulator transcription factor n=1 Tax=Paenibacillus sp. TaxID=58172 RepID=UPI002D48DFA3|nr:response regulator transcription factor [Paenibacillus sp.]HZG56074.1 response regulator transcription factor [Paenibacillus sp.]
MDKPLLLLVDDDRAVKHLLSETLELEGFLVMTAGNGIDALKLIEEYRFDLILLDIMMPGMDGLEVCKRIRDQYPGPIVLVSGRDRNADKVIGLSVGADDYITKPFEIDEVVSRVKAHLRREQRSRSTRKSTDSVLSFDGGTLVIHKDTYEIYLHQERVELSTKEFQILTYLAEQEGRVVSREEVYEAVWGEQDTGDIHTVTVHIKNLRAKIDPQNRYIKTVWGSGYKFTGEKD